MVEERTQRYANLRTRKQKSTSKVDVRPSKGGDEGKKEKKRERDHDERKGRKKKAGKITVTCRTCSGTIHGNSLKTQCCLCENYHHNKCVGLTKENATMEYYCLDCMGSEIEAS